MTRRIRVSSSGRDMAHGTYINPNSLKTHCKRGHSLVGCYVNPTNGQRICRACRSMRARARRRERSEAA